MPPKRPFSLLGTQCQHANSLEDLEAVVAGSRRERYRAELQPDGSILLVPEDYGTAMDTKPDGSYGACAAHKCCAVSTPPG